MKVGDRYYWVTTDSRGNTEVSKVDVLGEEDGCRVSITSSGGETRTKVISYQYESMFGNAEDAKKRIDEMLSDYLEKLEHLKEQIEQNHKNMTEALEKWQ